MKHFMYDRDKLHKLSFKSSFMGETDFAYYDDDTGETERITVRMSPSTEYERSITNDITLIRPVGDIYSYSPIPDDIMAELKSALIERNDWTDK